MPYIAFDLDALNDAGSLASAAKVMPEHITHGMLQLWAYCFRHATDVVSRLHVVGFFCTDAATDALIAFGYLAETEDGRLRVKGANRYLRIREGQSKGGKTRTAQGKRSASGQLAGTKPTASGDTSSSPADSLVTTWSQPGLTPSTEHRAPNVDSKEPMSASPTPLELQLQDLPAVKVPTDPERVFAHWKQRMGKRASAKFSPERRKAVEARLKDGYTVEDLCAAIDGCAQTPHNIGQNEQKQRFDDLELICRNASNVDRFMGNAESKPAPITLKLEAERKESTCVLIGA